MKKNLRECYTKFFGAGNPQGKYWFIAYEPGGILDQNNIMHIEQDNEVEFTKFSEDYRCEIVEGAVCRQLFGILGSLELKNNFSANDTKKYIHFTKNGDAFYTNLYLLKIRNMDDNQENRETLDFYQKYFDITELTLDRSKIYPSDWIKLRHDLFAEPLSDPKVIFIFKKNCNDLYSKLLGVEISNDNYIDYKISGKCRSGECTVDVYKANHLIFIFPNTGFSNNDILNNSIMPRVKVIIREYLK
jgi:hypothetical protein